MPGLEAVKCLLISFLHSACSVHGYGAGATEDRGNALKFFQLSLARGIGDCSHHISVKAHDMDILLNVAVTWRCATS